MKRINVVNTNYPESVERKRSGAELPDCYSMGHSDMLYVVKKEATTYMNMWGVGIMLGREVGQ